MNPQSRWFNGFESRRFELNGTPIHARFSQVALAAPLHTACEDCRASADINSEHDCESRAQNIKAACDLLVLWGERGVVHRLFYPMALWRAISSPKRSPRRRPRRCGNFFS